MPEIQASFLYPFPYAPSSPLGEGERISGELSWLFLGFVCRQPHPANPFSKPLNYPVPNKQNVHGIVPGVSRNCPGTVPAFSWDFLGMLFMCFLHQNRASPFASHFYRRRAYRREFCSEDHFYPFSSQKKSRFASDFLRKGNCAFWGPKKSRDSLGSGENRRRSRRESRDFGALSLGTQKGTTKKLCDQDFAERSGELSGAICLKTLVLLGNWPVTPPNCSENSLVLLVRFYGFVGLSWLLISLFPKAKCNT